MKDNGKVGTAGKGALVEEDVSFTLAVSQDQTMFQPIPVRADGTTKFGEEGDPYFTLRCGGDGGSNEAAVVQADQEYVVRRLMPVETERLQAFPDGWTDITGCDVDEVTDRVAEALGYDEQQKKKLRKKVEKWSKDTPDTPRYKAMGNSMTTLVIELLGRRIQAYDELHYDEVGSQFYSEGWSS